MTAAIADWFDARVRRAVGGGAEGLEIAGWDRIGGVATDERLSAIERWGASNGHEPRATLTMYAGWSVGWLTWILAVGVLRDGVLVLAGEPDCIELGRHPVGYYLDVRIAEGRVAVAADHPWARDVPDPAVAVLPDRAALEQATAREIIRAGAPLIDAIAQCSGRGRAGLWGLASDSAADAIGALVDDGTALADAIAATTQLLSVEEMPWRRTPEHWVVSVQEIPTLVKRRCSCCLYYRRAGAAEEPVDPADAELFAGTPHHYCSSCVFRSHADVEARTREYVRRSRAMV